MQTGPKGKPVNVLYVAQKMKLKREMYFALLLDRASAGPVMIGCSEVHCRGLAGWQCICAASASCLCWAVSNLATVQSRCRLLGVWV
jgi:hypothetical protein